MGGRGHRGRRPPLHCPRAVHHRRATHARLGSPRGTPAADRDRGSGWTRHRQRDCHRTRGDACVRTTGVASDVPVAIALRTIPLVAITPLLVVWLGIGYAPKVTIAARISFFPTLVNVMRGFGAATPDQLELMHALAASPEQDFRLVRRPASLPYLFAALRVASTSSVLGAIVAKLIGSDSGLGYLIVAATFEYAVARLGATITISTATAVLAFLAVVATERAEVPRARDSDGA